MSSHKRIKPLALPAKALVTSQVRYLNLHEYQAKQMMAQYNINVQRFAIAETIEQAQNAAQGLSKEKHPCLHFYVNAVSTVQTYTKHMEGCCNI